MPNNAIFPKITGHYGKMYIDLEIKSNLTFLYGDSGKGKTYLAKALSKQDLPVIMYDYTYIQKDKHKTIKEFIETHSKFIIIIDNADIILNDELRSLIFNNNNNNQFIIIGRNPEGLFLSNHNIADIVVQNNSIKLNYKFMK